MRYDQKISPFDVAIVGGGPAGAATAISLKGLDASLSIAVLEASEYLRPRVGETLPPTARPLLERLGVWDALVGQKHAASYGTSSAWGSDELSDNEFINYPHGRGWHLDRARFDAMLAGEAAARGASLFTQCRLVDAEATAAGVRIRARARGRPIEIDARFAVDATGRGALLARKQGARRIMFDRLAGAFVFYRFGRSRALQETYTLVEAFEDGWWYSAPLQGSRMVVACMTDADVLKDRRLHTGREWAARLASTRHTSARARGGEPEAAPAIHAAYSHRLDRFTGERWLAAGDAAMTFDPLSSLGIFKALRSGMFASYAIFDYFKGARAGLEKYEKLAAREFEDYLEARGRFYAGEPRWARSAFWQRRHERITLDPRRMLRSNQEGAAVSALGRLGMHMAAPDLKLLHDLCDRPLPAHEVVSAFKARAGSDIPDRRIILALQYLIEQRVITALA